MLRRQDGVVEVTMAYPPAGASGYLPLVIDTGVWLDYYLGYRPGHRDAFALFELADQVNATLCYAVTTSKDLFYLISADFKRECRRAHNGDLTPAQAAAAEEVAWACLDHMDEIATAVGCDQSDVWLARKQRGLHGDYGDNLVVSAARRSKAACLVTNDENLVRHCPVTALDVRDAIAFLKMTSGE